MIPFQEQLYLPSTEIQPRSAREQPAAAQPAADVAKFIREKLLVEVASPEEDLLATGVLDSLTLIELLVYMEERLGVKIPLEELEIEDLRSIHSITRMLHRRMHPATHGVSAE